MPMFRDQTYRNKPPNNVVYPVGAVQNLADNRDWPVPQLWFPMRLRPMGYGDWRGLYEDGQPRKVYRPDKLPADWKSGAFGQGYPRKESIWMVTDVDNRKIGSLASFTLREC